MNMTILSPGPLSTIQDVGRFGAMGMGFSPGGVMDSRSMQLANLLVGNAAGVGVVEMTMAGLTARFDCDCVIALTGADMCARLEEQMVKRYQAISVHAGDTLRMQTAQHGMRAYLAVAGGFDLPTVMGSMSTNLKCRLGGFHGRKLQRGDVLPLNQRLSLNEPGKRLPIPEEYPEEVKLRVLLGPQEDAFTRQGLFTFLNETYTVTDQADRMGIRLSGAKIDSKSGVDIISD